MSKVTSIKIKQSDGSYKSYQIGDIQIFNTIADVTSVSAGSFLSGDKIRVLGYYAAGDGGGGDYIVTSPSDSNTFGVISIASGFTKMQLLKPEYGYYNILQFGITQGNCSTNLPGILTTAPANTKFYFPSSIEYTISSNITITNPIHIFGDGINTKLQSQYPQTITFNGEGTSIKDIRLSDALGLAFDSTINYITEIYR